MTKRKKYKSRVRERMNVTGDKFTKAKAEVDSENSVPEVLFSSEENPYWRRYSEISSETYWKIREASEKDHPPIEEPKVEDLSWDPEQGFVPKNFPQQGYHTTFEVTFSTKLERPSAEEWEAVLEEMKKAKVLPLKRGVPQEASKPFSLTSLEKELWKKRLEQTFPPSTDRARKMERIERLLDSADSVDQLDAVRSIQALTVKSLSPAVKKTRVTPETQIEEEGNLSFSFERDNLPSILAGDEEYKAQVEELLQGAYGL